MSKSITIYSNNGAIEIDVTNKTELAKYAVRIEDNALICKGVSLKESVFIGGYSCLSNFVQIGNDVTIYENVTIRDDAVIGNFVKIGWGSVIGFDAMIGNNVVINNQVQIENNVQIGGNVVIGRNVIISSGSIIGSGCTIPDGAFIGDNAVIDRDTKVIAIHITGCKEPFYYWGENKVQVGYDKQFTLNNYELIDEETWNPIKVNQEDPCEVKEHYYAFKAIKFFHDKMKKIKKEKNKNDKLINSNKVE